MLSISKHARKNEHSLLKCGYSDVYSWQDNGNYIKFLCPDTKVSD